MGAKGIIPYCPSEIKGRRVQSETGHPDRVLSLFQSPLRNQPPEHGYAFGHDLPRVPSDPFFALSLLAQSQGWAVERHEGGQV